ncbi:hypothetical protein [Sodalis sp. dw_96]|uniref:hypothetical protein n=1 Tax=Sodalis sp. dw_96 TaxID=2719794 RepID=UPI001BD2045F|nr:hypothetical protein [Sodalis sp. dw_96]
MKLNFTGVGHYGKNHFIFSRINDRHIYSPVFSLFMLPITWARNLPTAEDRAAEEAYRTEGRALYHLAQEINDPNTLAYENSSAPKLRIQSVTQAAMAGLYATQTLAPPAVNNSRIGHAGGRGADNLALASPPPDITAGTSSNPRHRNSDPRPHLPKINNTEVSFNLMYLPDNEYPAYKGTRFFAVPIYKNRPPAPALLPPEVEPQQPTVKKNHNEISFQFFTVPHDEYPHYPGPRLFARPVYKKPVSVPALPPPYIPTIEQRPGRQDLSPGLDSSGRAAKEDTVRLSAVDERPAPASLETPVNDQRQDPDGKVSERPVLEEIIAPGPSLAVIGGSAVLSGAGAAIGGSAVLAKTGAAVAGSAALAETGAAVAGSAALAETGAAAAGSAALAETGAGGAVLLRAGAKAAGGGVVLAGGSAAAIVKTVGVKSVSHYDDFAALSPFKERDIHRTASANKPALSVNNDIADLLTSMRRNHIDAPVMSPGNVPPKTLQQSLVSDKRSYLVKKTAPPGSMLKNRETSDMTAPLSADLPSPDVSVKIGKAEIDMMKSEHVFEAAEIARPAERVAHRPPGEILPESQASLAKPGVKVPESHVPLAGRKETVDGGREKSPLDGPERGELVIVPLPVARAAAGHAQEAVRFTEAGAGLSARAWPDAPARSSASIIDQCKIKLAANEEGVLKPFVDSDYYGHVPIYELVAKDAAFSQPVYRHYIEIKGEKAAVKLSSTKGHGIKYAMIDESKPDIQHALSFNDDRWQLQTPTAEEIDPSLLDAIRTDMIDPHFTEHMLSAPDDRGLQWTKDQKSYLRIKGRFIGVSPSEGYVNCYEIRSQDDQHALSLHYKDGLFRQLTVQPQELVKYGQQNTFLKQRSNIKKLLDKAKQDIENNRVLKGAHHINKAFQEHRQYEAGSIHQLKRLAMDFIKKCVFRDEKVNLATAEITAIQEAWLKNIKLPLKTNAKVDVDDIEELFMETPVFCKKIINYLQPSESKNIFKKFASALDELSTTPMPLYGVNPKTLHYNLVLKGTRTATKIAISGNDFFIALVTHVLNGIKQTALGQKILLALREKAFTIHPPTMSAIERVKDGIFYAKNSAGGAIAFDPGNFIIGDGKSLKAEPWRNRDPAIALYHELLHIYYNSYPAKFTPVNEAKVTKGALVTKTADKTAGIIIAGGGSELEEAMITGTSFRDPITKELYDFKNNEYIIGNGQDLISENYFRKEYAIMRGSDHYFIRSYYIKPNDMTDKIIKFSLTYHEKNK